MMATRLDRATVVLGAAAMVSALAVLVKFRSDTRGGEGPARVSALAQLSAGPVIALVAAGALAVAGGLLGNQLGRVLATVAGVGLLAVAGLKLGQDMFGYEVLAISRPAMALCGAFAVGLLAVALTPREGGNVSEERSAGPR